VREPIACSLTTSQAAERARQTADIASRALRGREAIAGGQRLRFAGDRELEDELRAVVAAEAECCSFLDMRLRRGGGVIELDITGPAEARPIIEGLFV
jgi:hypothetical protein